MTRYRICGLLALAALSLPAQELTQFEKNTTDFTLSNGLHFVILERHEAPVVSFRTYVAAGSVNDPGGKTGLAHMFEHMAFKGTESIGTRGWADEKAALAAVEAAWDKVDAERNKGPQADPDKIEALERAARSAASLAKIEVDPEAYQRIIEESGGADLNAETSMDSTEYYYSLPSNRVELWFLMESQRFLKPVFREFYEERDVVMEEYRMRVDSSPQGRLVQEFTAGALQAHPYRNPGVGWPSDLNTLRSADAREFFQTYYVPGNMTVAIVGDINPAEAKRLAEKYFGPLPARPLPPIVHTMEPPQTGPRTIVVESSAQPLLVYGYKRPDQFSKDDLVFDVLSMILSNGRTGLLNRSLVEDQKVALQAQAIPTFPGGRYPNLFLFFCAPAVGRGVEENRKALDALIETLRTQKVDAAALARAKAQARAAVLRRFDNNTELATLLAKYQGSYGDWRRLFTEVEALNKVTAEDVLRVARTYFVDKNRTVAYTVAPGGRR